MATVDLLAPSRAGDKFHYYWAARRALELLRPGTSLVALSIESRSPKDESSDADEIVDVGAYYGREEPLDDGSVTYTQLKHSTLRLDQDWTISDLSDVITKFGNMFKQILEAGKRPSSSVSFRFVTNRHISDSARDAIARIVEGRPDNSSSRALRGYLFSLGDETITFLRRLELDDSEVSAMQQVDALNRESSTYLVTASNDLMLRLKELVANRAADINRQPIRRADVLLTLQIEEADLLPAPTYIEAQEALIDREVYEELRTQIISNTGKCIVHAAGGVGKSSFTSWLAKNATAGDVVVVFDCFAGGSYREHSRARHEHHRGLVHIANEFASRGLSDPLVPIPGADSIHYMRAFMARFEQAAAYLEHIGRRLFLVVDAADNAVSAAESIPGSRAFALDLLREQIPGNARIVFTARTERVSELESPPDVARYPLRGFNVAESKRLLEAHYGSATDAQAAEFHERTWGNPRVQRFALERGESVDGVLSNLLDVDLTGPVVALDELISTSIAKAREAYGSRAGEVDRVCAVLASMRPVIEIDAAAGIADVPRELIESFLSDVPFSLVKVGEALYFRDEPTETYFMRHFRPDAIELDRIIDRVEELASSSYYLASALPQLMWESKRYSRLMELALFDAALPASSATEAREVAESRAIYALRAALTLREWTLAGRLALRVGRLGEASGVRTQTIAENADLAGRAFELELSDRYVASRALGLGHPGFNLAREGLLLSMRTETSNAALGRLRSAFEWFGSYSRIPHDDQSGRQIRVSDVADLLLGRAYSGGADALLSELSSLSHWVLFPAMRIVARRLVDRGRVDLLESVLELASERMVVLACAQEIWEADLNVGHAASKKIATVLARSRGQFGIESIDDPNAELSAVVGALVIALQSNTVPRSVALRVLSRYINESPPTHLGSWYGRDKLSVALAYALAASLRGEELGDYDLASDKVRNARDQPHHSEREVREYRAAVIPIIPWFNRWASAVVTGKVRGLAEGLDEFLSKRITADHDGARTQGAWAIRLLTALAIGDPSLTSAFVNWVALNPHAISDAGLVRAARAFGRSGDHVTSTSLVSIVDRRARTLVEGASARTSLYVDLARAVWSVDEAQARDYFLEALDAADLIGDEVHHQWQTLTRIARSASAGGDRSRVRGVEFARVAESLSRLQLLEIDPGEAVQIVADFSLDIAIAVASQWRDRDVAPLRRSLGHLVEGRPGAKRISPGIGLGLASLHDEPVGELARDVEMQSPAYQQAVREANRRGVGPGTIPELVDMAASLGELLKAELAPEYPSSSPHGFDSARVENDRAARRPETTAAIEALNLADPEQFRKAFELATWANGVDRDAVFLLILSPSRRHLLAGVLRTLPAVDLSTFDARRLIVGLGGLSDTTAPVNRAIRETVSHLLHRFHTDIVTLSYDPLSIAHAADLVGSTEISILEDALLVWSRSDSSLSAEHAFGLATTLSKVAGARGAGEILDTAISQFAELVDAAHTEVPVLVVEGPEVSEGKAIAGLVWAALGDPETDLRWKAANAVVGLVRLKESEVLRELASFAASGSAQNYCDPSVEFYRFNAEWFLLLALDRCLLQPDARPMVETFAENAAVMSERRHALIAPLARRVAARLSGQPAPKWPIHQPKEVGWGELHVNTRGRFGEAKVTYKFDWDFIENVIQPLADAFGIDSDEVDRRIGMVITRSRGRSERGMRDEDLRHARGLYREGTTYDRYASPRAHDLDYYLSLHATMEVAAEIADAYAPLQERDAKLDEFRRWMKHFEISRDDGYWVSEYHVSTPPAFLRSEDSRYDSTWLWGVVAEHFLDFIVDSKGWITAWANIEMDTYTRDEHVRVHSAFVPAALANACVRSLQLDRGYYDFRLPSIGEPEYGDEEEIENGSAAGQGTSFKFTPWVRLRNVREGIDRADAVAEGLEFPPPLLGGIPAEGVRFSSEPPRPEWQDSSGTSVAYSESWRDVVSGQRGHSGSRLQASPAFVRSQMEELGTSLIVSVAIDRSVRGYRSDREKEEGIPNRATNHRVLEYRSDGTWRDYRGRPQTRATAGEHAR